MSVKGKATVYGRQRERLNISVEIFILSLKLLLCLALCEVQCYQCVNGGECGTEDDDISQEWEPFIWYKSALYFTRIQPANCPEKH